MTTLDKEARAAACRGFTLAKGWEVLSKAMFAESPVSQTQYDESKKIYYATFHEFLALLLQLTQYLSEDAASAKLGALSEESAAYHEELFRGKWPEGHKK